MPQHMINPIARCERCGAKAMNPCGPVTPMEEATKQQPPLDAEGFEINPKDWIKGKTTP